MDNKQFWKSNIIVDDLSRDCETVLRSYDGQIDSFIFL